MGENSNIEWTHHSFNPWMGCTMVAPECTHCYAKTRMDDRLHKVQWGPKGTRVVTSRGYWSNLTAWNLKALKAGEKHRVFCASLADVFEEWDGELQGDLCDWRTMNDVRAGLWERIKENQNLIFLLLTKRPENIRAMVPAAWLTAWPANVWTGTSAGCQETADKNIPALLMVPGPHFLSCEPMLGAVNVEKYLGQRTRTHMSMCIEGAIRQRAFKGFTDDSGRDMSPKKAEAELRALAARGVKLLPMSKECDKFDPERGCLGHPLPSINWVICGGESGPGARPMHPEWARGLRDQCLSAGVPFFFKQWGEWLPGEATPESGTAYSSCATGNIFCVKGGPERQNFGTDPDVHSGHLATFRVGKKTAGRMIDGRTWDELPAAFGGVEVSA